VFHLAAIVSGMAEADFDLGMRINLDATRQLLDVCRGTGTCPRVVFTSSVAVYGGDLPDIVLDATALNPQTSYGTQKAAAELLISDYTRKGFIDGRVLRLPTISVRPGRPNAAASSFASGVVREPLNGQEAVCPVDPDARMWVLSPSTVVECLIVGHDIAPDAFGRTRAVNLPGLSVSAGEMVAALARVAGPEVAARVRWERDPRIARMVASWPGQIDSARARSLGFPGDDSFDQIIRDYIRESLPGPSAPQA
jgi:nucleoside-diphosphate-sugar epimerase